MIAVKILDVKIFMEKLFKNTTFDNFLMFSSDISTFVDYKITGDINTSFHTTDELEILNNRKYVLWSEIKPYIFNIIKGNKTPTLLKIVFLLSPENIESFVRNSSINMPPEQISGLFINVKYENGLLTCITGTSIKTFTLDKTVDDEWDEVVKKFLKKNEIAFE